MGTERIVTPEALKQAVAALRERGIKESARTVYDELGGGSMTTIANLLREFRKLEAQQQTEPAEPVALPPALDAAMRQSAGEMWKAAQHECAVMVAAVKTQAQNDVAEANAERDAHLGELEATTRELEEAREKIRALQDAAATQAQELAGERIARNTAETRTNELDRHLQELQADIKAERARRDEAEAGRRAAEQALGTCQAETARLQEQVSGLTQRLADAGTELTRTRELNDQALLDLERRHADELARTRAASEQSVQEQQRRHSDELGRMEAKHAEVLGDQKRRSLESIDKLQKKNQRLESEATEHVKAAQATAEQIGRLQGELEALKNTGTTPRKGSGE